MNSIGDRYTCTDSACGCEIEMKQPCRILDRDAESDTESSSSLADETSETESEISTATESEAEVALTCFCGNVMKQIMDNTKAPAIA